ncbi:hypothetical protein [Alkaliphilus peptidifermentans]|uniref:MOSC domain-containing protein n=1 Tax=Alkaliphilus peptidifermentans DSM 18978 TaxID=1120976 RepID=A0A1G5KXT1_9FIRM|nr:hypothetical protein [Alkaliphilus peptidifermentans]SCZ05164.1 hypothetical protein SAMN03080606_03840 [Alkaliphilus peptidifermentans DSM 18978]
MANIVAIFSKGPDKSITEVSDIYISSMNYKGKNKERQISIITKDGYDLLKSANIKGFCHFKFYADLMVDVNFPGNILKFDKVSIGNSIIEITSIGKECHKDCPLMTKILECTLRQHIAFASIIKDGLIKKGDDLKRWL